MYPLQLIIRACVRLRIHPNVLTFVGVLINIAAAWALGQGRFATAGVIMIVANIFDFIDGKVAVETGEVSEFGGFWDSVIDRFSDLALSVGLICLYASLGNTDYVLITSIAMVFATMTIHLGKPPPHVATLLVKGPMVALRQLGLFRATRVPAYRLQDSGAPFPGHAWLLWNVLTARDRYLAYRHARRWVIGGGLVVSDRMPLSQLRTMDGCRTSWLRGSARLGYLARRLVALEMSYYAKIEPPDVLIVLRVDPAIAVQRKLGEDDPGSVRERAGEVFDIDDVELAAVPRETRLQPRDKARHDR
jgi:hypothetical protein